jgi:hypothetical protein
MNESEAGIASASTPSASADNAHHDDDAGDSVDGDNALPNCNCLASHFLSQKSGGGLVKTGPDVPLMKSRQMGYETC